MIETAAISVNMDCLEAILREELAQEEGQFETLVPVMRHLLANDSNSIFSDAIVAGVRGSMSDIACQLLGRLKPREDGSDDREHGVHEIAGLTGMLSENPALVEHLHASALEWQWTVRLQSRLALDPVLSPLLQELIASPMEATSAAAMKLLAAQARFCQSQRRLQFSLYELPGDLLNGAIQSLRAFAGADDAAQEQAAIAEASIRRQFDKGATRIDLLAQLVEGLGSSALAALSIAHAGAALFLSALAIGSGLERERAVVSTDEGHVARFALGLRAAGLKPKSVEEQVLTLHPDLGLPEGFERLNSDRAAAILSMVSYRGT